MSIRKPFVLRYKGEDLSPFVIKLESFLRATDIPYEYVTNGPASSHGKKPWIWYKGQQIDDSQKCIEFLTKTFGIDLDENLTAMQKSQSTLVRKTVEHSMYFQLLSYRWDSDHTPKYISFIAKNFPWYLRPAFIAFPNFMASFQRERLLEHGIGHFSKEEIVKMTEEDTSAILTLIDGPFFHGQFSSVDCCIYAALHGLYETLENDVDHIHHRSEVRRYCKLVRRRLDGAKHNSGLCKHTIEKAHRTGRQSILNFA